MIGPRCSECGKQATEQDIDGGWWPPCAHAKLLGIHTLRFDDEPTRGSMAAVLDSIRRQLRVTR